MSGVPTVNGFRLIGGPVRPPTPERRAQLEALRERTRERLGVGESEGESLGKEKEEDGRGSVSAGPPNRKDEV